MHGEKTWAWALRENMEKTWRKHGENMENTWRTHGENMDCRVDLLLQDCRVDLLLQHLV
jgi:hypothetical protein